MKIILAPPNENTCDRCGEEFPEAALTYFLRRAGAVRLCAECLSEEQQAPAHLPETNSSEK